MRIDFRWSRMILCAAMLAGLKNAAAQTNFSIYADQLAGGFQDWSWGTHSLTSTDFVHSGTNAVSFNGVAWQAISFWHQDFNPVQRAERGGRDQSQPHQFPTDRQRQCQPVLSR